MALPPIISEDTNEVIIRDTIKKFMFNNILMVLAIDIQHAPDITPHISPITSLKKLATLSVFFLNDTAILAPFTFLAAIELKTLMLEAVTATPIMSNRIPKAIKNSNRIIPNITGKFGSRVSDVKDIIIDIKKVVINIFIIHP